MIRKIFFVTSNAEKVAEVRKVFDDFNLDINVEQKSLDIVEPDLDCLEDIAVSKVTQAFKLLKKPCFVEDSGIFFKAYKNFPGPISSRVFKSIGYEGIFNLLRGKNKDAFFEAVIAFKPNKEEYFIFKGKVFGKIIDQIKGKSSARMPYDSIFVPYGYRNTFAELGKEIKNKISHRRKAAEKFAKFLKRYLK